MRIAVTGATCFLGRRIVSALQAHGHDAVSLSRRPFGMDDVPHLPFDLAGSCPTPEDLEKFGIEALVHCAWDYSPQRASQYAEVNIEGARRLLDAAKRSRVTRLVCISSMSAFAGCRSTYGRTKLEVEALFADAGGVILRPGLIWGENAGGMVGTLDGLVRRLPIVPMIGNGTHPLFLVHADDLAELICRVLEAPAFPARKIFTAAFEEAVPLRRILELRAQAFGLSRMFLPVPWQLIWLGLRGVELVVPGKGPRSDSVLGFIYSNTAPHFEAPERLVRGFPGFRRFAV